MARSSAKPGSSSDGFCSSACWASAFRARGAASVWHVRDRFRACDLQSLNPCDALGHVVARESTSPGFNMTARAANHATTALVPGRRWVVRSLRMRPAWVSLGTSALTVSLARELLPLWAAAFAGLFVGLGSELVVCRADLRAYSPLVAFGDSRDTFHLIA